MTGRTPGVSWYPPLWVSLGRGCHGLGRTRGLEDKEELTRQECRVWILYLHDQGMLVPHLSVLMQVDLKQITQAPRQHTCALSRMSDTIRGEKKTKTKPYKLVLPEEHQTPIINYQLLPLKPGLLQGEGAHSDTSFTLWVPPVT